MQERKIDTFIVKFDKEIKFSDISHFRSGVLASMQHDADVLFHNHLSEKEYRYSYPLIQYKRINKKAAIVCVGDGCTTVGEFFSRKKYPIVIGEDTTELNIEKLQPARTVVQVWDSDFYYSIRKWLPFNSQNYNIYISLEGIGEKTSFLESILIGNMLSMAKGLGLNIDKEIKCKILDIGHMHMFRVKGIKFMAFDAEFKANVSIPNYLGIGKHASLGFGMVVNKRRNIKYEE